MQAVVQPLPVDMSEHVAYINYDGAKFCDPCLPRLCYPLMTAIVARQQGVREDPRSDQNPNPTGVVTARVSTDNPLAIEGHSLHPITADNILMFSK